jgi:hypothetical protein
VGIFSPNDIVTRAELVKVVAILYGLDLPTTVTTKPFSDVALDAWYTPYIAAAKTAGIISGYANGSFQPNRVVSRAEALKIVLEATKLTITGGQMSFSDTTSGQWYEKYVAFAVAHSIVSGYANGSFGPANSITRAELAKIAMLSLELLEK